MIDNYDVSDKNSEVFDNDALTGASGEESESDRALNQLEDYLNSIPARNSKGTLSLDRLAGAIVYRDISNFSYMVENKGWGAEEDLKQSASLGIFKAWLEIMHETPSYLDYADGFKRSKALDIKYLEKLEKEADFRKVSTEQLLDEETELSYMYREGRREVYHFIKANIGISGSSRRAGERNTSAFSSLFPKIVDEDDAIEMLDNMLRDNENDDAIPRGLLSLAYHNAHAKHVIEVTCGLLNIDETMNFPDRDLEKDSVRIQSFFIASMKEVLMKERMYSGIGPNGKPRYRKLDPMVTAIEDWCIDTLLFEGETSISLAYIRDMLEEKPLDWEYDYSHFPRGGASPRSFRNYETTRDAVRSLIEGRERAYNNRNKRMPAEWFSSEGDLLIISIPQNMLNEIMAISSDIVRGIDLRKDAWKRVKKLLLERKEDVAVTFKEKVYDYLTKVKGEAHIW